MTSATEYARAGNPASTVPVRVQNRSRTSAAGSGGWRAQHTLAAALPNSWVAGSSGSPFRLAAA
jgi:hypothetical protein